MRALAIRHGEHHFRVDLSPIGVARQKNKLRVGVDKIFDQPWTSDAVHFNFLASDPFHELESCFVATWFWYAVVAAVLYGAHQIFTRLAPPRTCDGLGVFVVAATSALSLSFYLSLHWLASRWHPPSRAQ